MGAHRVFRTPPRQRDRAFAAEAWKVRVPVGREFRPAPDTFADVDEGASVVVAVPAEGLHGGCAGAGPLRYWAAGRAPTAGPVRVRAPGPTRAAALRPA